MHVNGRKKEASKVIQTTKQSNTAHPRQSLFQSRMSCLGWDTNPRHSAFSTTELPGRVQILHLIVHLMNRLTIFVYINMHCTCIYTMYIHVYMYNVIVFPFLRLQLSCGCAYEEVITTERLYI